MNPPLINPLQKLGKGTEESGDADDGDVGAGHEGSTGAGAGRAAGGAGAGGGGTGAAVGSGGVGVGGITLEATLDNIVALQLAEIVTAEVTAGALHVEATLDVRESTKSKPIRC